MTQQNNNLQYFNDAQQFLLAMNTRDEIAICGRGFGKGAVQAGRLKTAFQMMPGSGGGFVSPSVKRCLTNILPSVLIHLETWGLHRDLHYVVGHRPPKALHWQSPIFQPESWENCLSFYNGSVCNIISQDVSGTSNSLSLDYVVGDEAKFLDPLQFKEETLLANRGNEQYFSHCFMHHGITLTTDMPMSKKSSWTLDYEKDCDYDMIAVLWQLIVVWQKLELRRRRDPASAVNLAKKCEKLKTVIDNMRKDCLLYVEFSSLENIDVLGEDYIRRMKRDLSDSNFRRSVGNVRLRVQEDGFYNGMDEQINLYTAPEKSKLMLEGVGTDALVDDCRLDADLDPLEPVCIAMDINARSNFLACGQASSDKLRVLKSFFVKFREKRQELIDKFDAYYKYHPTKVVIFYFDATFVGSTTGKHDDEPYVDIENLLIAKGWVVIEKFIGAPMKHVDKNQLINDMFKGKGNHLILINRDNNPDLVISIENAGTHYDKKDKSDEKKPETEGDLLEHRTDFSDAFDTLAIGVEKFPPSYVSICPTNKYDG